MAKQPEWSSPRSRRASTNDPEKYAKGSVRTTADEPGKKNSMQQINDPFDIDKITDEGVGFDVEQDRSSP